MGRHSAPDDDEVVDTSLRPGRPHGTQADLDMLRDDPALRARCIAAAVVPLVLYTALMVAVGQGGAFMVWVWIPIVLAGIGIGAFLDLGHRNANRESPWSVRNRARPDPAPGRGRRRGNR